MAIVRAIIGRVKGETEASPPITNLIASDMRYFEDLRAYLAALAGLIHMAEVGKTGKSEPYRAGDTVRLDCGTDAASWFWEPVKTVTALAHNIVPDELLVQRQAAAHGALGPTNLGAMGVLLEGFGQVLATNYFERYRPTIDATFGGNPHANWPQVWNFARVVRNSMAHKGRISIDNPNAPPVTWRGLSYCHADNGKKILHADIWPADLMDLLVEMDSHMP